MEAVIFNKDGKETGKINLPENIFGLPWNGDLVHQVVLAIQNNQRTSTAHTKDRSEVRGGGKKPWRQKGLGRARHGSSRSPIWRGGGITFGPRNERDYSQKVNKKAKAKALFTALSQKMTDSEIIFIDELSFAEPKTKDAKALMEALTGAGFEGLVSKKKNAALIALPEHDSNTVRSFNNLGNVTVEEVRNLNTLDVMTAKYVIVVNPEKAVQVLGAKAPKEVTA